MPTKTVAAGGGNFTAGATWVGGVAPVAGDDIVANATSGNLTINATTVSLLGANFTGYTGTLAFGNNVMTFNTAGSPFLTLSSGMTITFGSGHFYLQRSGTTITSPVGGKAIPFRGANFTYTLVNDLHIGLYSNPTTTTFTGANVILTMTSLNFSARLTTMATGFKMIYKPTATATLTSFMPPLGHFAIDTTNVLTIENPISFNNSNGSNTWEYIQAGSFTGSYVDAAGNITGGVSFETNNSTCNILLTNPLKISEMQVGSLNVSNGTLYFQNGANINNLILANFNGNYFSMTSSIFGIGTLTASNVYMYVSRPSYSNYFGTGGWSLLPYITGRGLMNVKLSPTFSYSFGTVSSYGQYYLKTTLSSTDAVLPATVSITSDSYFANTDITRINNTGTNIKAYSSLGNTLTSTTGFTSTEAGGGAGGSFTFVN